MKKRVVFALTLAILLLLAAWACTRSKQTKQGAQGPPASSNTLSLWWSEKEEVDLLKDLDEKSPEFNLNFRILSIDELNAEFLRSAASGAKVADIANIDNPFYSFFASKGLLLPLDEYIAKSPIIDMGDYFPGPRASVSYQGKVYGIPNSTNTLVLFYNRDLYQKAGLDPDKPPRTWEELYEYAKKLNDPANGVYGLHFSFPKSEEGTFQFLPWAQMLDRDWNNIDTPEVADVIAYLKRFIDEGLVSRDVLVKGQDPAPFISKTVAMQIVGPWALQGLQGADFNWSVAMLPINPKYNIRSSAMGGLNIGIPTKAENPDLAFKLIEKIRQIQGSLWNTIGYISPVANTTGSEPNLPEVYDVLQQQMQYARPRGPDPNWTKISPIISDLLQQTLSGSSEISVALQNAAEKLRTFE